MSVQLTQKDPLVRVTINSGPIVEDDTTAAKAAYQGLVKVAVQAIAMNDHFKTQYNQAVREATRTTKAYAEKYSADQSLELAAFAAQTVQIITNDLNNVVITGDSELRADVLFKDGDEEQEIEGVLSSEKEDEIGEIIADKAVDELISNIMADPVNASETYRRQMNKLVELELLGADDERISLIDSFKTDLNRALADIRLQMMVIVQLLSRDNPATLQDLPALKTRLKELQKQESVINNLINKISGS